MHGLIFETSVCYWQNQPGYYLQDFRLLAKKPASGTTPGAPATSDTTTHTCFSFFTLLTEVFAAKGTEFFTTGLCLLRLTDRLHLSSQV
jgi:hypothetical protein